MHQILTLQYHPLIFIIQRLRVLFSSVFHLKFAFYDSVLNFWDDNRVFSFFLPTDIHEGFVTCRLHLIQCFVKHIQFLQLIVKFTLPHIFQVYISPRIFCFFIIFQFYCCFFCFLILKSRHNYYLLALLQLPRILYQRHLTCKFDPLGFVGVKILQYFFKIHATSFFCLFTRDFMCVKNLNVGFPRIMYYLVQIARFQHNFLLLTLCCFLFLFFRFDFFRYVLYLLNSFLITMKSWG